MTHSGAIYVHRRRQAVVVLLIGFFGVVLAAVTVIQLPAYLHSLTAADGHTLHLVAQTTPFHETPDTFFVAQSTDGVTFGEPSVRSGRLAGVAALDGWLYCLMHDGSVARLSGDQWVPVPAQLDWRVLGIAVVDGRVQAFGQTTDHLRILTATLTGDTWLPGAPFAYEGDNIGFFQGVRAADHDYLLWVESKDTDKRRATRLHLGTLTDDRLEVLPSLPFDVPIGTTAVGDAAGVQVFFQKVAVTPGLPPRYDPRIQVVTFRDGRWDTPTEVAQSAGRWLRAGDFTAAELDGTTRLYIFRYWFGYLYAGMYVAELQGDRLSDESLILPPTPEDLVVLVTWMAGALAASFVAAGGLAGLLKLKHFERQRSPLGDLPLYASVTDRAAAATLDFALVYLVVGRGLSWLGPLPLCVSFLAGFAVYGTVLERWLGGQTIGKKLLGLRVLKTTGGPVDFRTALVRNLFKFIEMMTIGAGVCLTTRRFQRPGDFLAGTVVVKELHLPHVPED